MATTLVKERNPLDWYSLTESTNSILNGLMAYAGREQLKESKKANPDQKRLNELSALFDEVQKVNNNTANFKSLERMEELIDHYSPMLLATKKKAS